MHGMQEGMTGVVVIIDELAMRRACIVSALEPWATLQHLRLVCCAPTDVANLKEEKDVRLVLLNTGGSSLAEPEQQEILQAAKALSSGPCAVISDRLDANDAVAAAGLGLQAFLPAMLPLDIVKQALSFIMNGGTYFPREALLATVTIHTHTTERYHVSDNGGSLTQRQAEVLERLRFGRSNKHIARELNMQEATVKVHVRQIMRKLGAENRTQAALLAQSKSPQTDDSELLRPQASTDALGLVPQNGARAYGAV